MADNTYNDNLSGSMDGALKHYSSMFSLPSYKRVILIITVLCIGIIVFSTYALFLPPIYTLKNGILLGITLCVI
ncbi:MAG: hypothetical protein LBC03_04665, partial [Nitrososphaerota archaeon]|nr:hypothetical protein [Nitrososphaerota archaeon]